MMNITDDRLKMIFGFSLLLVLAILAGVVAVGKITQESSFGLQEILSGLLVLAGGFAQWAFSSSGAKKE